MSPRKMVIYRDLMGFNGIITKKNGDLLGFNGMSPRKMVIYRDLMGFHQEKLWFTGDLMGCHQEKWWFTGI